MTTLLYLTTYKPLSAIIKQCNEHCSKVLRQAHFKNVTQNSSLRAHTQLRKEAKKLQQPLGHVTSLAWLPRRGMPRAVLLIIGLMQRFITRAMVSLETT